MVKQITPDTTYKKKITHFFPEKVYLYMSWRQLYNGGFAVKNSLDNLQQIHDFFPVLLNKNLSL
jgi:hypothetical protein